MSQEETREQELARLQADPGSAPTIAEALEFFRKSHETMLIIGAEAAEHLSRLKALQASGGYKQILHLSIKAITNFVDAINTFNGKSS